MTKEKAISIVEKKRLSFDRSLRIVLLLAMVISSIYYAVKVTQDAKDREMDAVRDALATLNSHVGIGYWKWDFEEEEIWWSDTMFRVYGVDKPLSGNILTYDKWLQYVHPDDVLGADAQLEEALQTLYPTPVRYRVLGKDGQYRLIYDLSVISQDKEHMVGICVGAAHANRSWGSCLQILPSGLSGVEELEEYR